MTPPCCGNLPLRDAPPSRSSLMRFDVTLTPRATLLKGEIRDEDRQIPFGRMLAALTLVLLLPATALGYGFVVQRGLIGLSFGPPPNFLLPDLSGNNVVYMRQVAGGKWYIQRFNIATGGSALVQSDATYDLTEPAIDGDWVVWNRNADIRAKNIKSGATKNVTNDGGTTGEGRPR